MYSHIAANASSYLPFVLVFSIIMIAALLLRSRGERRKAERVAYAERLIKLIQPEAGLEYNFNLILEVISTIADAHGYAFYIRDPASNSFILRSVRHRRQELGQAAPAYSGLSPYRKEIYLPPLRINDDSASGQTGFIREGDVPLLHLSMKGNKGLIRIGPIEQLPPSRMQDLAYIMELLPPLLDVLLEADRLHTRAEVVETSVSAMQAVSSMAMNPEAVAVKLFSMAVGAFGMNGGCFLVAEAGNVAMPFYFGWSGQTANKLADSAALSMVIQLIGNSELVFWDQTSQRFSQLHSLLHFPSDSLIAAGRLPISARQALFLCSFHQPNVNMKQLKSSMMMMINQLAHLVGTQERMKSYGQTSLEFLKRLAAAIDELNPFTVGYCELMSRYSIIIAKELGFSDTHIRDIGIAAYLSNIGLIGFAENFYLKEGKLSEVEFEKMKFHAELGASIVEMTIGSKEIADCIRFHHERIDGHGYPSGLSGDDIPAGARILAVVQTFLAKINGRHYRAPLPFDKAIAAMETLSGTQLDSTVVKVFIRWLDSKRRASGKKGKALGACWEMCCTPLEVCRLCPAFNKPEINCWEVKGNNCHAHGKSCETCFVYTETLTRSGMG